MIKKKFPQVVLLSEKKNHGFAKGNNLAAAKARGEHLLFLNSDTILFKDTLEKALKKIRADKDIGALGIKLLNKDRSVQRSIFRFPSLKLFLAELLFLPNLGLFNDYRYFSYQKEKSVDFVSGAFLVIPKKVFELANEFDDKFFMYGEETDLCKRIKKLGYKILFYPAAKCVHLGGSSSQDDQKKLLTALTGKTYYIKKHHIFPRLSFFILALTNLERLLILFRQNKKNKQYYLLFKFYLGQIFKC